MKIKIFYFPLPSKNDNDCVGECNIETLHQNVTYWFIACYATCIVYLQVTRG